MSRSKRQPNLAIFVWALITAFSGLRKKQKKTKKNRKIIMNNSAAVPSATIHFSDLKNHVFAHSLLSVVFFKK